MSSRKLFGHFMFCDVNIRPDPSTDTLVCDFCGLQTHNDPKLGLFSRIGRVSESLAVGSIACAFCVQASSLNLKNQSDGILYLLPELEQASLIRLVVAAYSILYASSQAKSMQRGVQHCALDASTHRYFCKAARRFLDLLNRVGTSRWHTLAERPSEPVNDSKEFVEQLLLIEPLDARLEALRHAASVMRYVPVMSEANRALIRYLAQSYWHLPDGFNRWFAVCQKVERLLAEKQTQHAPH